MPVGSYCGPQTSFGITTPGTRIIHYPEWFWMLLRRFYSSFFFFRTKRTAHFKFRLRKYSQTADPWILLTLSVDKFKLLIAWAPFGGVLTGWDTQNSLKQVDLFVYLLYFCFPFFIIIFIQTFLCVVWLSILIRLLYCDSSYRLPEIKPNSKTYPQYYPQNRVIGHTYSTYYSYHA